MSQCPAKKSCGICITPFPQDVQAALVATKTRAAHFIAVNPESAAIEADTSQANPPASLGDLHDAYVLAPSFDSFELFEER